MRSFYLNESREKGGWVLVAAACVVSLFVAGSARGQEAQTLSLAQVIEVVRARNLTIEAKDYTLAAARAAVLAEEGKFDPTLNFNLAHSTSAGESPSQLDPTLEEGVSADMSLQMRSSFGPTYELRLGSEYVNSNLAFLVRNPYYRSEVSFIMVHPLLRDLGEEAAGAGLRIAGNQAEISRLQYEQTVQDAVFEAVAAYWDLYFVRADLEVADQSLQLARNLLVEVQERVRAGKLASIEAFKAEAEVADRRRQVIEARKAVRKQEDLLRSLMNAEEWDREILPVDVPPAPEQPPPLDDSFREALEKRPDYRAVLVEHDNRVVVRRYRADQKQPRVDLTLTLSSNSVDEQISDPTSDALTMDTASWSAGLNYSRPLGGGEADGQYSKALYEEGLARVSIQFMAQKLRLEVRDAWRNLWFAIQDIEATRTIKVAAETNLMAEEEKFRVGKSTLSDVLEYQAAFARTLSDEKRAAADYAISLADLARAKGSLRDTVR